MSTAPAINNETNDKSDISQLLLNELKLNKFQVTTWSLYYKLANIHLKRTSCICVNTLQTDRQTNSKIYHLGIMYSKLQPKNIQTLHFYYKGVFLEVCFQIGNTVSSDSKFDN